MSNNYANISPAPGAAPAEVPKDGRPTFARIKGNGVLHEGIGDRASGVFASIEKEIRMLDSIVKRARDQKDALADATERMEAAYERASAEAGEKAAFEFFSRMITESNYMGGGFAHKALLNALSRRIVAHEEFESLARMLLEKKPQFGAQAALELSEHVVEYLKFIGEHEKAAGFMLDMFYRNRSGSRQISNLPADLGDAFTDGHFLANGRRIIFKSGKFEAGMKDGLRRIFDGIWREAKEEGVDLGRTPALVSIWLSNMREIPSVPAAKGISAQNQPFPANASAGMPLQRPVLRFPCKDTAGTLERLGIDADRQALAGFLQDKGRLELRIGSSHSLRKFSPFAVDLMEDVAARKDWRA
ncbi:MAG: hypothetical protein WC588_04450 [Candidatus Micrarchaeia archaeon]